MTPIRTFYFMLNKFFFRELRGVFRPLPNIYDEAFFSKIVLTAFNCFRKNSILDIWQGCKCASVNNHEKLI